MDDEILFKSEDHESVESAAEVFPDSEMLPFSDVVETAEEVGFPDSEMLPFSDVVETAEEVGFPDSEPSAAEYVAEFGENVVYREDQAQDDSSLAGDDSVSSSPDPVVIPALDDATIDSIRNIESNTSCIESYVSSIDMYLSRIDEAIPEFDFKIAHIESDVRQIGRNAILFQKISAGLVAALFGAIIVIIFFSKFR